MASSSRAFYDVDTTISYLARHSLWADEKPYIADFAVPEGASLSNQIIDKHQVTVRDLRGTSFTPTLESNGFCLLTSPTQFSAAEVLENRRHCEKKYFEEICTAMYRAFPRYRRFECIDLTVRKRDATFPWTNEVKLIEHEQPAAVAHTDYSLKGALMELSSVFPGQEDYFEDKKFDVLNVWRPLIGPNDDWPLALCDASTICGDDIRNSDVVHYNRIGENALLHPNAKHRWFYLSAQMPDECFVFRNVGTDPEAKPFYNPFCTGEGRISAEARVIGFY